MIWGFKFRVLVFLSFSRAFFSNNPAWIILSSNWAFLFFALFKLVIGLYFDDSDQYAAFFDKNNQKEIIKSFKKLSKNNSGISKRTFKYQDGTIINLDDNKTTSPILLFYPSGENSGGIIELYYEENIQRILIKNNGEISNEIHSNKITSKRN